MSLLKEKLIGCYKDEMISFLNAHPEYFEEAIELAVGNEQPFSWRAAWLLWSCMEENDNRVQQYLPKIVETIEKKDEGHQRELLKILLKMELEEEQESMLFDQCMKIWEQITKPPAVRVNALKMILKIAEKYPELLSELTFLKEEQYLQTLSPGARHSVSKLMKKITQEHYL